MDRPRLAASFCERCCFIARRSSRLNETVARSTSFIKVPTAALPITGWLRVVVFLVRRQALDPAAGKEVRVRCSARFPLLVVAVCAPAVRARDMSAPALPGGITDPAGRTGFFVTPAGKIDAVDLVSGDVLWTADARRPLFAFG